MDCILKEPTGLSGENRFERGGKMHAGEQPEDPAVVLARDAEHWAQRGNNMAHEALHNLVLPTSSVSLLPSPSCFAF